jgi:3-hydroxybutyryl-CoA dehydrogenase
VATAEPVVVIGAGRMGTQIGVGFALSGHPVHFCVRSPGRAQESVSATLSELVQDGLATAAEAGEASSRTRCWPGLDAAPPDAGLVVESVTEHLAAKADVLRAAAQHCADAVLASNTSSLRISDLAMAIGEPGRMMGMHFWHPPLYMPLVELVATKTTESLVAERARRMVTGAGWTPVTAHGDVPGFIWNRLQCAVLREALWLLGQGVCGPEDIDLVARLGLARRWQVTGPMAAVHLGGIDTWNAVAANLFPELSATQQAPDLGQVIGTAGAGAPSAPQRQALLAELIRTDRTRTTAAGTGPARKDANEDAE